MSFFIYCNTEAEPPRQLASLDEIDNNELERIGKAAVAFLRQNGDTLRRFDFTFAPHSAHLLAMRLGEPYGHNDFRWQNVSNLTIVFEFHIDAERIGPWEQHFVSRDVVHIPVVVRDVQVVDGQIRFDSDRIFMFNHNFIWTASNLHGWFADDERIPFNHEYILFDEPNIEVIRIGSYEDE